MLLSHGQRRSTIAAEALHFRVRDGNGCYILAMVTGKKVATTYTEKGQATCAEKTQKK